MKKKTAKRIWLTLIHAIILLIVVSIIISSLGVVIKDDYADDYNEFYLFKKEYDPFSLLNLPGAGSGIQYKVWFLPGQKEKMLAKIREDVDAELENLTEKNSDLIKNHEINDDFTKIYIYFCWPEPDDYDIIPRLHERVEVLYQEILGEAIGSKVELYTRLFYNGEEVPIEGQIINIIEVEEPYDPAR